MEAKSSAHDESSSTNNNNGNRYQHHQHSSLSHAFESILHKQDVDEQAHWDDVCRAYRTYANFTLKQWGLNHPSRLAALPAAQQGVLPEHLRCGSRAFQERQKLYKEAAIRNQFGLDCILRHSGQPHSQEKTDEGFATEAQFSKVSSVLKSLARDWSAEGKIERDMAYLPILNSIQTFIPISKSKSTATQQQKQQSLPPPKICVPGAGVGRLACEIAARGYSVQGNEFSLYMLLASDFILNSPTVSVDNPLQISPWLLETRNVHAATDPLRAVQIPDADISTIRSTLQSNNNNNINDKKEHDTEFSMAAGEFVSIYSVDSEAAQWDGVVACFFLDASPVIIEYLQVIYQMLKPGGHLINFGPLLWHWSGPPMGMSDSSVQEYHQRYSSMDPKYLNSVDFAWEDIEQILVNIGFEIVHCNTGIPALYTADRQSMLLNEYRCVHFVARKRRPAVSQDSSPSSNY